MTPAQLLDLAERIMHVEPRDLPSIDGGVLTQDETELIVGVLVDVSDMLVAEARRPDPRWGPDRMTFGPLPPARNGAPGRIGVPPEQQSDWQGIVDRLIHRTGEWACIAGPIPSLNSIRSNFTKVLVRRDLVGTIVTAQRTDDLGSYLWACHRPAGSS